MLEDRKPYILNCDRCSHCKWTPGARSNAFAQSCPSIYYGNFHAYSASGKNILAYGLIEGRLGYSEDFLHSVYACSMCGACDAGCKWNHSGVVEPLDTLYALRQRLADDGQALPAHVEIMQNLRMYGNPRGLAGNDSLQWADGLGLKEIGNGHCATYLHVGWENASGEAMWPGLRVVAELFRRAGFDFGVARDERSTGELAFDLGFVADARAMAEEAADRIRAAGVGTIITCSASSYAAFRNVYPRLGIALDGIKIVHVTDAVEEVIAGGLPVHAGTRAEKVTYHDPCKLGRLSEPYVRWDGEWTTAFNQVNITNPPRPVLFGNKGNYESPRALLRRMPGIDLVEMERSKAFSFCCGAAAGAKEAIPEFAEKAALHRLDEAMATGATTLVSVCASCTGHLREVAARNNVAIQVRDLFELLADRITAGAHA